MFLKKARKVLRAVILFSLTGLLLACASTNEKNSTNAQQQEELTQYLQRVEDKLLAIESKLGKTSGDVSELKQVIDATLKQNQPPPPPSVTEVSMDDDPVMGNENAQIAIVEFSDFQCPYCAAFHQRYFSVLKRDYIDTGKVKFVYRDLALDFHPEAENAAIAANCAGEQGSYYAMHDLLFANQKLLNPEYYSQLAQQLKLDNEAFDACYRGKAQKQEVRADLDEARKIGITGTPVFFIGRVKDNRIVDVQYMEGAQTPLAFSRIIDALLEGADRVATLP